MTNATLNGNHPTLTPADTGILAAAYDDAQGLGDDDTVELMAFALRSESGFAREAAEAAAYAFLRSQK